MIWGIYKDLFAQSHQAVEWISFLRPESNQFFSPSCPLEQDTKWPKENVLFGVHCSGESGFACYIVSLPALFPCLSLSLRRQHREHIEATLVPSELCPFPHHEWQTDLVYSKQGVWILPKWRNSTESGTDWAVLQKDNPSTGLGVDTGSGAIRFLKYSPASSQPLWNIEFVLQNAA